MKCPHCKGAQTFQYDDEVIACSVCDGDGAVPRLWWWWFHASMWFGLMGEHVRFSRFGWWYWRKYGCTRRARVLAANNTLFQLQAIHGHRLVRLRQFATHIENGYNVQFAYGVEQRLCFEAARACEIAIRAGSVRPKNDHGGGEV